MNPKPLFYLNRNKTLTDTDWLNSATQFWIENDNGSIYIERFGHAWVVRYDESYLTRNDGYFTHKFDIPSFKHSYFDDTCQKWDHLFKTKEEALECYLKSKQ